MKFLKKLFAKDLDTEEHITKEEFDKQKESLAQVYILMKNMYGGEAMSMLGRGMAKPVFNHVNLNNNTNLYFKYAVLPATEGVLANSFQLREEMRKTMPADLYQKWEEGATFEEIAEEVIASGRQNELVSQSIFRSGVKTGAHRVNKWGAPGNYQSIEVSNDFMGIQLNASQNIEDTENTSSPVQITAVQNGVEEDSARRFDKLSASFARTGRAKIREAITRDGVIERGLFFKHLRQLGKNASQQMAKLGKFTELVQNPNINLNLRQVRTKLVQFFINDIIKLIHAYSIGFSGSDFWFFIFSLLLRSFFGLP